MNAAEPLKIGMSLWAAGKLSEAAEAFGQAVEADPDNPIALGNYGMALAKTGQPERALPLLLRATELAHKVPEVWFNLGRLYHELLRLDDSINAFTSAIALRSDFAEARWTRSLVRLLAGDFLTGWEDFDWRFRLPGKKPPPYPERAWDGRMERLAGKTLILTAEQGFGDTIQFARYIPLLADAGAKVILMCHPELVSLLRGIPGIAGVCAPPVEIAHFDFCAPLMSLGKLLCTAVETIPSNVPYLSAQPSNRLARFRGTKKIGIVWAGRPTHPNDRRRSISLSASAPIANLPGVALISLQKGPAAEEIRSVHFGSKIFDLGNQLEDFSDTAAVIGELDLLISVDTSVVHLAGALGKPVWTLLPYNPDWRWMLNRDESPWYPAMRLFRQDQTGDWSAVIEKVRSQI